LDRQKQFGASERAGRLGRYIFWSKVNASNDRLHHALCAYESCNRRHGGIDLGQLLNSGGRPDMPRQPIVNSDSGGVNFVAVDDAALTGLEHCVPVSNIEAASGDQDYYGQPQESNAVGRFDIALASGGCVAAASSPSTIATNCARKRTPYFET
jgi:hypothetical protein